MKAIATAIQTLIVLRLLMARCQIISCIWYWNRFPLLLLKYVTVINTIPVCSQQDKVLKMYFIYAVGIYLFPTPVLHEKMH